MHSARPTRMPRNCRVSLRSRRRQGPGDQRRTLIWPLLSTGAPRTREAISFFRGVITGLLLIAALTAAWDFRMTASACRCTKHLSKGRPPGPEDPGDCGAGAPRPRNSSVPPRRPFKTAGSSPKGVPVRCWLGRRAATRRTIKEVLQVGQQPGSVPGANPSLGVRGIGVSVGSRTRGPQHSHARDARPPLAPVRRPAPRHGPVAAAVGVVRRASEAGGPDRAVRWRRSAWRRRPHACVTGDTRSGPGAPPAPPRPAPCRASSRGVPATSWPARWCAGTGRRPRRRPT
jgi:hypothetical protein